MAPVWPEVRSTLATGLRGFSDVVERDGWIVKQDRTDRSGCSSVFVSELSFGFETFGSAIPRINGDRVGGFRQGCGVVHVRNSRGVVLVAVPLVRESSRAM